MNDFISNVYIADPSTPMVRQEPRAYSMENPSYPIDDPSIWNEGITSEAGRRVGPVTALHLPAFYQAVTRISSDVARCPLELYQRTGGAYTALEKDPLYRLTAIQPNREMDAYKFWCRVMTQRLVYQNAYIFIARNLSGQPAELLPLLSDRTRPKRRNGILIYETQTDGQPFQIPAGDIIHIEGIGLDNVQALELCKLMRDAFGLALAQMGFAAKVFRGGGRRGGVLELPLGMPKKAADNMEEGFRRKYEDEGSWFTTVILRDNVKFHEAQMSLRDSQSMEGREESARDVARAMNIRPGHVGVESSGVYGNKSDDTRDYLSTTLQPHMTGICSQCRIKLLPLERQGDHVFDHNTEDLLEMSVTEEFTAYGIAVEKTLLTSNEARGKLGFPAHADGNKLQNPNTKPAGAAPGAKPTPGAPKPKPAAAAVDDNGDPINAAHHRLLLKSVSDIVDVIGQKAIRASASGAKFMAWLETKWPAERDRVLKAIGPIADCLAASRHEPMALVHGSLLDLTYGTIDRSLQSIADSTPEAELRAAVTNYFETWEFKSCEPQKQQAA